VFNLPFKVSLAVCILVGYSTSQLPPCFSQSLGQSEWQIPNQSSGQSGQPLGQSDWQIPGGNAQSFGQVPGLAPNPAATAAPPAYPQGGGAPPSSGQSLGQSAWQNPNPSANQSQYNGQSGQASGNAGLGLSPWQQPQNSVQANTNQNPTGQPNSDYYYGQINQNQANPNAFGTAQYSGQANASQPNNQYSSNLPPASSIPPQQQQTQQSQGSGLKGALTGFAKAAGLGMGVAAPLAGVYMMTRAMTNSYGYGMPAMPYGYGYPGMAMPMTYSAPNYAMMNMAPMYSSALSGLSSFMTH